MPRPSDTTEWQRGCLDEAVTRLAARVGEATLKKLTEAATRQGWLPEWHLLLASSEFFVEQSARQSDWLLAQIDTGALLQDRRWDATHWDTALGSMLGERPTDADVLSVLRRFRHQQMLRILWRETARCAPTEVSCAELTELADCCIRAAVRHAESVMQAKHGVPTGAESGEPQSLVVLAMGKLGGRELNFSSDIDLIFAYAEGGVTEGGRQQLDNQSYFTRLGQMVIRLLDAVTEDGFAFRVDMRLRPYGDSGALVGAFNALEVYYQEQGREWERYAMMKARPVTGDAATQDTLMSMLTAFVYRRYTDFSVISALREMKTLMRAEVARLGMDADLKRGAGGIREVEFIAQSMQLIHGGRRPELRYRGLLDTLAALSSEEVLSSGEANRLATHYLLLRRVEHALQAMQDKQTQTLPASEIARAQLAALSGYVDWDTLDTHLSEARREVAELFNNLIAQSTPRSADGGEALERDASITLSTLSAEVLDELGFQESATTWSALEGVLDSAWVAALQPEGRRRLEQFVPRLCVAAANESAPDLALTRSLPFVKAVCRRSAYLVLLQENPRALGHLLSLVAASQWIADRLAARPELVDELLHESTLYSAPDRGELQSLVRQQLLRIPEDDLEAQMNALSRIKDGVVLRVAASELMETLPLMKVSDNLTYLAEVMITHALAVARTELVKRHGEPQGVNTGFAVMAYGKLGGLELSYASDLDLVFVFDGAEGETVGPKVIDNTRFYTRLAQRIVHVLSAQTYAGRLYEVDLRLRPDGDSGLVATSFRGLQRYQFESAWVWEHQALVRARPVAGDAWLQNALIALRRDVLMKPRNVDSLAAEVCAMRAKMRAEHASQRRPSKVSHSGASPPDSGQFDLKRDPGGIVDIEFVVQFLVLAHAQDCDQLTEWSDVVRLLEALEGSGRISQRDAQTLSSAYLSYRGAIHVLTLQGSSLQATAERFQVMRDQVRQITESLLPGLQSG